MTTSLPRNPKPAPKGRNRLKIAAGAVVVLLILYFIFRSIWAQWDQIRAFDWAWRPLWLLAGASIFWCVFAFIVQLWRIVLAQVSGRTLPYGRAYSISARANLGKYIPGKVWAVMGMVYLLRDEGIPMPVALAASAMHQAYTVLSGLVFAAVALGSVFWSRLPWPAFLAGIGICLVVVYPPVFSALLSWGLRLTKRPPVTVTMPFPKAAGLFVAYIVAWIAYGTSFWLMLPGFGVPPGPYWPVTAAFGAAYLLGFLALFAPGGLGVREGVLALLLTPHLPAGLPVAVAVVSRLWMTVVELLGLVPLVYTRRKPDTEDGGVGR